MRRRTLMALAALAAPVTARAQAQPWQPTRPIRLIVPYAAGGGTDILARALAEALRPALPHPVIVENRAGARRRDRQEMVVRAEPDGHTLLLVVSTHVMNRFIPTMPYDPIRDFTPVAMLTRNTMVLAAAHTLPFDRYRARMLRLRASANPARRRHRQHGGAVATSSGRSWRGAPASRCPTSPTAPAGR